MFSTHDLKRQNSFCFASAGCRTFKMLSHRRIVCRQDSGRFSVCFSFLVGWKISWNSIELLNLPQKLVLSRSTASASESLFSSNSIICRKADMGRSVKIPMSMAKILAIISGFVLTSGRKFKIWAIDCAAQVFGEAFLRFNVKLRIPPQINWRSGLAWESKPISGLLVWAHGIGKELVKAVQSCAP